MRTAAALKEQYGNELAARDERTIAERHRATHDAVVRAADGPLHAAVASVRWRRVGVLGRLTRTA